MNCCSHYRIICIEYFDKLIYLSSEEIRLLRNRFRAVILFTKVHVV